MDLEPVDNLVELMNSPAIRGHVNAKPGDIYKPTSGILDFTGKKIQPKEKKEMPAVRKMREFIEFTINDWINKEIKEILPEELHDKIEDRKTLLPILVRFGIEYYVEFIKDPQEEGLTEKPNKYGAHIVYITIKGEPHQSQVFIWETEAESGTQSL